MDIVLIKKSDLEDIIRDAAMRAAEVAVRKAPKDRELQLTKSAAARELSISRPTLDKLIANGKIFLNTAGRISTSEIDRFLSCRCTLKAPRQCRHVI